MARIAAWINVRPDPGLSLGRIDPPQVRLLHILKFSGSVQHGSALFRRAVHI